MPHCIPLLRLLLILGIVAAAPAAADPVYMIVTSESLASEFEPLALWRTAHGLPAEVRTVEWITAHYSGADDAESVRLFLQDAYASLGTSFLLLGGDSEVVPVRYARTTFYTPTDILTDYYFMCLDGTWNGDGDEHFGEVEDAVDLLPEICAGRAPVSTALEARTFVERTIAYESALPEPGYPASALFLAERLTPGFHGAVIAEEALGFLPSSFSVLRLYEEGSFPWPGPGALPLTREAAITAINAGYGLVHHIGRGTEGHWGLGDSLLTIPDVQALTNAPRFPVVCTFSGWTAAFDFGDAIGEHWLTNPGGGAAAYIGATSLSWIAAGRDIQREWFRLVFDESVTRIGLAAALARLPFVEQAREESSMRCMFFTIELLGDPALAMHGETPAAMDPPTAASPFLLGGPAPNPFADHTSITVHLLRDAADAEVSIYDANGRLIHRLFSSPLPRGRHALRWSGAGLSGKVPPGTYFVRFEAGGTAVSRKVVRLQ